VNNMGVSYMGLGEMDKALEFMQRSYEQAQSSATKGDLAQVLNNIGFIYMKKNQLDTALSYYKRSQKLSEESGNTYGLAESINHVGFIYKLRSQPTEALKYYQKSLSLREKLEDEKGISNSLNNIAACYIELHKFGPALENANRSLEIGKRIGNVERIRQAAFSLKTINEKTGNYQEALKMYELYIQMRDSTMNETTRSEGLKKNLNYEYEKRELLLKEEQTRKEALNAQKRSYYIIFSIILLLFIIAIFYQMYARYKHKKEREKHDLMLRIKDSEIKALQLQMNPHFIFNSLNSVLEFISKSETEEAIKYLTKFSRLIRLVLEFSNRRSIFLSEEIELLGLYVDLENIRSEKGFNFILNVEEDLDPRNYEIPSMLLQPFIENSIIHGIQNKVKISERDKENYKGELKVSFSILSEFLKCIIEDNGIGREKALEIKNNKSFNHLSLGMQITRERLNLISQRVNKIDYYDLKDENNTTIGTRVEILIPLLETF
jgi:tetratricopeptide (TPR) repeat protein